MTPVVLGAAWTAMVLTAVARHRPAPPRVRALAEPALRSRATRKAADGVVSAVGRLVQRRLPVAIVTSSRSRTVGTLTVAALAVFAVAPLLAPLVIAAAVILPGHRARVSERRRLRGLEAALPDTVDLLVLAVGAGCNVSLALAAAGRRGSGPLADEVRRISAEVGGGRRLADALDDLPVRAGEPTRPLAAVLAGCERYGTPVLPALHRLADDVRLQRQRRAEATARRVPVTLLFPLIVCILPAFALLTVAPLVAGALRELRL
ncbi:MAG TPA: type II secretion system F family protein [Acidimicrobiales bacterium]|nr:type II secretion system F family protein [Acidimicrobiales bacterium]